MKSFFRKIIYLPVYVHLLAVFAVSGILVYSLLKYIDSYTNHDQAVHVPDVRGLQVDDAAPFLAQNMLRYYIIDSIYLKEALPGAIVELIPEANSKVKKNRIIYITINAKSEETAPVPDVKDISYREAYARLRSRGFDVETKWVPGEFHSLTIGVEYNGKLINSDTRVPKTAKLILVVSNGSMEPLVIDTSGIEKTEIKQNDVNWF